MVDCAAAHTAGSRAEATKPGMCLGPTALLRSRADPTVLDAEWIENGRHQLQDELDARRTRKERNRLGQFGTPGVLAREVARCALALLPAKEPISFLEPGFGTGAFYSALLRSSEGSGRSVRRAVAVEVDHHYARPAALLWKGFPLELIQEDFLNIVPAQGNGAFNLILGNPPYVRHHHLQSAQKKRFQAIVARTSGMNLGGLAGLYCYFLGAAHAWMSEGGVAAWLIPSEFMDVNYGRAVKEYLLKRVTLLRIHRFEPKDVQFADALVSSAVVFLRNGPPNTAAGIEFTYGGNLEHPRLRRVIGRNDLDAERKWTRFPAHEKRAVGGARLSDFFEIRRGLATGANRFFILERSRIERLGLPINGFRPVLPSPRNLAEDEIASYPDGTPVLARQLFLLDCPLSEQAIQETHPTLWSYLQTGVRGGVRNGYLCRHRRPWYAQEHRPVTPFLCTCLGRTDTRRRRPFRFLLNHSRATAANAYLLLYPKTEWAAALRQRPAAFSETG
jgi:adenine-specific DNA-methyltransferase